MTVYSITKMSNFRSYVIWFLVVTCAWILPNVNAEETTADKHTAFQLASLYMGYVYPVPDGEQWRLIDIEGNPVNDVSYDNYVPPFDKTFRYGYVSKGNEWFRIISTGRTFPLELPKGYDLTVDLGQGLLILEVKDKKGVNNWRVYNTLSGEFIGERFFSTPVGYGGDNLLPVSTCRFDIDHLETISLGELYEKYPPSMNLLDLTTGKEILDDNENYVTIRVSEGVINITVTGQLNNYSYLVDRNGEQLPIRPDEQIAIGSFKNGVAWCYLRDNEANDACLIDRTGRILCSGYKVIDDNSSGMSRVVSGKEKDNSITPGRDLWGFINTLGEEVIPCQFYSASHFHNGLAIVRKNDDMKVYLINSFGDELCHLQGLPEVQDSFFLEFLWKAGVFARQIGEEKLQLINIEGTVLHETSDAQEIILLYNRYHRTKY